MPTGNTTSNSLCIKHIRKVRRCLGGGPSDRLAAQGLPGDRPAQSTWAGIHLSWALGSLIFLPQHSTACLASLIRQLSGDILLALDTPGWRRQLQPRYRAHQERCDICSALPMGALLAPPTSFTHRYTHFKLSSVFQESRKYLLKIFMQKLFMAWPTSTPWQPLHNAAQRSPYLEEHTDNFAAHKSPRSNSSGFSIKSGT